VVCILIVKETTILETWRYIMNDVFKALADPTRRVILELLAEEDRNAGEIAEYFNISKPSISHHLNILKNADLISDERQGQNIVYSLNTTVFQEVIKWFFDFTKKTDSEKNDGNLNEKEVESSKGNINGGTKDE